MTDIFRTMILRASITPLAQQIAATLSPAGAGMWTTPLSPTGATPATHYISTGQISPDFAHMVPCQTWEQDEEGAWVETGSEPGDPVAVYEACNASEMEVTLEQVEAVFDVADVTEQDPFVAMARMGLSLVSEE
jgi:hypothetical protein